MMRRTVVGIGSRPAACLLCQWRSFSTSYQLLANKPLPKSEQKAPTPTQNSQQQGPSTLSSEPLKHADLLHAPRSYGQRVDEFTPTHLSRPIGMNFPPSPGENTAVDSRSIRERRAEFVDYSKHLEKRQQLKSKLAKPYFREWTNLKFHKGKSFLAPPRPFRADVSLYFPNIHGQTLSKAPPKKRDTTPLLAGRASIVTVFSSQWAEKQVASFVDPKENSALDELLRANQGRAQLVQVNVEEDTLKAWLVLLFKGSIRQRVGKENLDRYFIVRKGISDEIRESIGLLNSKVGYTYLVDHECRIRWAGSGASEGDEKEGLVKAVRRVLLEMDKEGVDPRVFSERYLTRDHGAVHARGRQTHRVSADA